MYSKARISGHTAHAMVVVFPIALFTSTVVMLLAYVRTRDVADIAGVITALIAMIPGALDMLALPRRARARALAYRHASSALTVTSVFAVAGGFLYRDWAGRVMVNGHWALDPTIPRALAVLGLVVLVGAATAGWSLVQTHHLGIKPALVHADRPSREPELDDEAAAAQAARMGTAPGLRVVRP
jgi:uncharacterized membrane protein